MEYKRISPFLFSMPHPRLTPALKIWHIWCIPHAYPVHIGVQLLDQHRVTTGYTPDMHRVKGSGQASKVHEKGGESDNGICFFESDFPALLISPKQ
ncbi:MAG: hypothetical protein Q8908_08120 [Bacteroidota bacterium]|nr:hypothetical protein [Bacteroidota bacterium]